MRIATDTTLSSPPTRLSVATSHSMLSSFDIRQIMIGMRCLRVYEKLQVQVLR